MNKEVNKEQEMVQKQEQMSVLEVLRQKYTKKQQQLYNQIKLVVQFDTYMNEQIKEEKEEEEEEKGEEKKGEQADKKKQKSQQQNDDHSKKVAMEASLNDKVVLMLKVQKCIQALGTVANEKDYKSQQQLQSNIQKLVSEYEPSLQDITNKKQAILQDPHESNWTDASDSQADGEQAWVVDDEMIQAMNQQLQSQSDQAKESSQEGQQNKVDFNELQEQFVKGGQSDHHLLYGEHEKFCVSVNAVPSKGILVSGGGDDYLHLYKLPLDNFQPNPQNNIKPYHLIKHTQTINKIEVSYSQQYVFSLTDNQLLCTELKTQETTHLKRRDKKQKQIQKQEQKPKNKNKKKEQEQQENPPICNDMCCHHLGDVIAVASQNQIQLYNIKGLKLYGSYYAPHDVTQIAFTDNGKQLCMVCEDNKIRVLTPKTSQIGTIGGTVQHKSQISVMKIKGNIIVSGCIDGYIGISSISNGKMMAMIGTKQVQQLYGSVSQLQFAGNYVMAATSQQKLGWYDSNKAKKLFSNNLQGSATDISLQDAKMHPNFYNVSTIKGQIYMYDCRNPLKQFNRVRAGNTIHKIWSQGHHLTVACEDGNVRYYDVRKLI